MAEPKLRFKREDGTEFPEWKKIKLENAVDFLDEKRKPITSKYRNKGQYPYYGASGIIDYIDDYIFDEELVLLSEDGANIVDRNYRVSFIATGQYWVNNHAHCLRAKKGFSSYFLSETLENIDFTVYNTGSAQPKLNQEVCRNLPLVCPCLEEQQKIASFLSTIDEVVSQSKAEVNNLEQQKKAAMQKIFSQEVRFRREDGTEFPKWENDKIGNCVNVTSCKRVHQSDWTDEGVPFYRAREIVALYNNEPIFPLHISNDTYNTFSNISGAISKGDLLITGVGTIGIPYLVKEADKFYFKDGNIIWFQNKEDRILGLFLFYVFGTDALHAQILNDSGKGTVHTFTIANAKETTIPVPCLEEQQKIADVLSAYDEAITYAKQELDKWNELKKGLLQQMFV